ncbi:hypothetical protein LEMLEM_LOCUS25560, partial [Lemmus lemmus]
MLIVGSPYQGSGMAHTITLYFLFIIVLIYLFYILTNHSLPSLSHSPTSVPHHPQSTPPPYSLRKGQASHGHRRNMSYQAATRPS